MIKQLLLAGAMSAVTIAGVGQRPETGDKGETKPAATISSIPQTLQRL